jgi:hypothetical protein
MIGQTFGQLTVLGHSHTDKFAYWHVKCSCGRKAIKNGSYIRAGSTTSCGCRKRNFKNYGCIYGIIDKKGVVKYVGQTVKSDIKIRLEEHLRKPINPKMELWLHGIDYKPTIRRLMRNVPIEKLDYAEVKAIKFYNKKSDLLNIIHNRKKKNKVLDLF